MIDQVSSKPRQLFCAIVCVRVRKVLCILCPNSCTINTCIIIHKFVYFFICPKKLEKFIANFSKKNCFLENVDSYY